MPLLGKLNFTAVATQCISELHKIGALESKSCHVFFCCFFILEDVENLTTDIGLEKMLQDDEISELSGANNVYSKVTGPHW